MSCRLHSSERVSELHSSLIFLILLKLPAIKDIVRFRRVCKAWYEIISDSYFTKFYVKTRPLTNMMVIQQSNYNISNSREDVFYLLGNGSSGDITRTPFNLKPLPEIGSSGKIELKYMETCIVGTCNGLLCVVETPTCVIDNEILTCGNFINHQKVWVTNPLTGESIKIPDFDHKAKNREHVIYGFSSTVDGDYYKLVRITTWYSHHRTYTGYKYSDSKILTIGVDEEWRDFDDPSILDCFFRPTHGVVLNGVLHYVCHSMCSDLIYAFDAAKEIGHFIPLPTGVTALRTCLSVWSGHLCLTEITDQLDVWTMKQYEVVESWTKDITIQRKIVTSWTGGVLSPWSSHFYSYAGLITYLLLSDTCSQNTVVSVDSKTKMYTKVKKFFDDPDNKETIGLECLSGYVPSFVSLGDMIAKHVTDGDS